MIVDHHHELITDLIDSDLSIGDHIQFAVTSNSMAPLIKANDSLVAQVVKPDTIKPGDIVVIRREADFLVHRAVKPIGDGWLTKGDNIAQLDPPSQTKDLIGQVVLVNRPGKSIPLQTRKWNCTNLILAKLSFLEAKAFEFRPILRLPFRLSIKIIQKYLSWRTH